MDFQYYIDRGKSPEEIINAMNDLEGFEGRSVDYLNKLDELLDLVN